VAVVGFNDFMLAAVTTPPRTTVSQDAEALGLAGREAADGLARRPADTAGGTILPD